MAQDVTAPHVADDWMKRAACRGHDVELFYALDADVAREALRICRGCPVRLECLHTAMETQEPFGVWGGMLERPRRRLIRREEKQRDSAAA